MVSRTHIDAPVIVLTNVKNIVQGITLLKPFVDRLIVETPQTLRLSGQPYTSSAVLHHVAHRLQLTQLACHLTGFLAVG